MIADFSFVAIRGGATIKNRQELIKFMYSLLSFVDASEVSSDEFDTSYDMIPRVVVQHSKEVRELQDRIARGELDAKAIELKKLNFQGFDTGQKTISGIRQQVDPRYGIMDAHTIDAGAGEMVVVNIAINTMTDVVSKTYMNLGIARRLNVGKSHDVISIITDPATKQQIEFYEISSLQNRSRNRSVQGQGDNSALEEYKNNTGIDINKMLTEIDNNVDATDATEQLKQIDSLIVRMTGSIAFMKQGNFDKPSIVSAEEELNEIMSVKRRYSDLQNRGSKMISIYFKIKEPYKLGSLIKETAKDNILSLGKITGLSEV